MNEPGSMRKFYAAFTALGVLVGILVIAAYQKDQHREWKYYQQAFKSEEIKRAATPQDRMLAETTPIQIRQILLPELQRVDRCTTCHLAVEDASYAGYPQPLSYHRAAPVREVRMHDLPSRPGTGNHGSSSPRQCAALG